MDSNARFLVLFQEAYPALHRYAQHRGLTAQDADDLVADTLEIAWRRLDDVPVSEPLPWLYGVARNVMRNSHRKDGRRALLFSRLTRLCTQDGQADPVAAAVLDNEALRKAIGELSDDDAELIRLVAWDGLTPAEVGVAIGCSAVAARTKLHRARNRLAALLGTDPRTGVPLQRSRGPGHIQVREDGPAAKTEARDG